MVHAISQSDTLTNFANDPSRYLENLRRTGQPLLLTVDGENGVIVQDAASYERFLDALDRIETIAAVKQGLADVAAGRTRPMRDALAELARKHSLPSDQSE